MLRYRLKIVLLSLGVVLGYGSAFAHLAWHRGHPGWHHGCFDDPWSSSAPAASKPEKPASNGAR